MEEMATIATEATEKIIVSDPEILAHIENVEVLMYYILGALLCIFLYGCFKISMKFFSMFF